MPDQDEPGWHALGSDAFPVLSTFNIPPWRQVLGLPPFLYRYIKYWLRKRKQGVIPFIDAFRPLPHVPIYGVPMGGMGGGAMGRGYRGEFCKFSLRPGMVETGVVFADQVGHRHRGLFPRAWTTYNIPGYDGLRLVIRQVSPVWKGEYKDTSLPACVFVAEIEARHGLTSDLDISLTLTMRNGMGMPEWDRDVACWSEALDAHGVKGVALRHAIGDMPITYTLAGLETKDVKVTLCPYFDPRTGQEVWADLTTMGCLGRSQFSDVTHPSQGVAVCSTVKLTPKKPQATMELCLVWDMPKVHFGADPPQRLYLRRYTRYFGSDGGAGSRIATYALAEYHNWESKIEAWQNPILSNESLPLTYRSALFNELYYLVDGGTVWFEFDPEWRQTESHLDEYAVQVFKDVGRFGYLECDPRHDHPFIDAAREAFISPNAYRMHDTARWRDLNMKFVLQTYRDYLALGRDDRVLRHCWQAAKTLIDKAYIEWDLDGDGMIENSNSCDQTYDAWNMKGTSAYCGSLFIGALRAAAEMSRILCEPEAESEYRKMLAVAVRRFNAKLWTGEYYRFDETCNTIMASQLAGCWYLKLCGISDETLDPSRVRSSLVRVYKSNCLGVADGTKGVVNGTEPGTGEVCGVSMQSREIWTAISYVVASHLLAEGYPEEAFRAASGIYERCFGPLGLQYQSPESITAVGDVMRAPGYMRPLAIWAMQWVLDQPNGLGDG